MNDSHPREIPKDMGYSRPLILSIGVHVLLAGFLWMGAKMHQAPHAENAPMGSHSSSAQLPGIPLAHSSSGRSPVNAIPAPTQTRPGEFKAKAVKVAHGIDNAPYSTAPAKALAATDPSRKPKHKTVELAAATKIEKPSSTKKNLARIERKTASAAPARTTKAEPSRNTRKDLAKQASGKPDVAEIKRLESMREAELRRISKSIS